MCIRELQWNNSIISSVLCSYVGLFRLHKWRPWSIASGLVWSLCWVGWPTSENAVTCTAAMTTRALMSFVLSFIFYFWMNPILFRTISKCWVLIDFLVFVIPVAHKAAACLNACEAVLRGSKLAAIRAAHNCYSCSNWLYTCICQLSQIFWDFEKRVSSFTQMKS